MRKLRTSVFIANLVALCVIFGVVDRVVSTGLVITGAFNIRIGLANIIVMLGLVYFPFSDAKTIVILKSFLTNLILNGLRLFIQSFPASVLSFLVMWLLHKYFRKHISYIGISVAGATVHITVQLIVVRYVLFSGFDSAGSLLAGLLPYYLLTSVIAGVMIGMVLMKSTKYIDNAGVFKRQDN